MKKISIVIPVYNEEDNLEDLISNIKIVLDPLAILYECIFVDDGSKDSSYEVLKTIKKENNNVSVIKFRRNYGQTQALMAGFKKAIGDIVIPMDADLQNDAHDIPRLIEKIDEGYDIVSGWREKRKDNFIFRTIPSAMANKLISLLTGVNLHDYGCTLKAYKKKVIKNIKLYGHMHRFIPAIASKMGANITEIKVKHNPRIKGVSKYGVGKTFAVILDLVTMKFLLSYMDSPMQFFGAVGFFNIFIGILSFIATLWMKLHNGIDITGNPLFYVMIFMGLIGIQCVLMGVLGEMNIRMYYEGLSKDPYYIEEE